MGPGDSKLLRGPTRIEGKESCESKRREKARNAHSFEGKNRISVVTGIQLFFFLSSWTCKLS